MSREEKELIKKFVTEKDMDSDGRKSCLMIALEDAKTVCEQDIFNKMTFIRLINYLLILDMIGELFTDGKNVSQRIDKALVKFGNITNKKDREAIYTLRNCLAHNYGLADKPKKIKFILDEGCNEMIIQPSEKWDGQYSSKFKDESSFRINPQKLIAKIISIYNDVCKKAQVETLDLCLNGQIEELYTRFTIKQE